MTEHKLSSSPSDTLTCPKCKRQTKRIQVDLEENDFGRLMLLGGFAAIFPRVEKAYCCEHCGKFFGRKTGPGKIENLVVKVLLIAIVGAVLIAVILLIVSGVFGV